MGESVVGERAARRAMSEIVGTVISDGSGSMCSLRTVFGRPSGPKLQVGKLKILFC